MSDQTPSTPGSEPTADLPAAVVPPAGAHVPPAEAYVPPPAQPAAPEAPATWPAAYPAAPMPNYASEPVPAYAAPAPAGTTSSNAIIALILAVVSWAVCPIIPAIVALVFAANATKEIAASGGRIQGQGLVTASRIVSWINIGLWSAVIVIGGFFLVLAIVAGGLSNGNAG
jgi:hypothetical protein